MKSIGQGSPTRILSTEEIKSIIVEGLSNLPLTGKKVLVVIPDGTRTIPIPLFFRLLTRHLLGKVKRLDLLVALGTHAPMDEQALLKHVGISSQEKATQYKNVNLINHSWQDSQSLVNLGTIAADEMTALSNNMMRIDMPVRINRRILDYDQIIICGPVFPHEIVGFSGGNKYFFPGIAGPEIIDITHWLGALITSYANIGVKENPVRQAIDRAASLIPTPRHAFCSVVTHEGLFGSGLLMYQELADIACKRITDGITRVLEGQGPIKALLDPYNPTGSTAYVRFTTSRPDRWDTSGPPPKNHVNWVILDSDWEAEFCRVAEAHARVVAHTKNHNLGFEVPYRYGSEVRKYRPDFVVLVEDGHGPDDLLHLVVEIKGYRREDAKEKKSTMETYWVPGVNNLKTYGRWAFVFMQAPFSLSPELR